MEKTGVDVEVCLNLKPEKIGSQTFFYTNFHLKGGLKVDFIACLG